MREPRQSPWDSGPCCKIRASLGNPMGGGMGVLHRLPDALDAGIVGDAPALRYRRIHHEKKAQESA